MREQIRYGADWIKIFPAGNYSFSPKRRTLDGLTATKAILRAVTVQAVGEGYLRSRVMLAALEDSSTRIRRGLQRGKKDHGASERKRESYGFAHALPARVGG